MTEEDVVERDGMGKGESEGTSRVIIYTFGIVNGIQIPSKQVSLVQLNMGRSR